jgi:uncharacterized protein
MNQIEKSPSRIVKWIEKNLVWILVALGVVFVIGVVAAVFLSLPPHTFTVLTGREGGAYYAAAQEYQKIAAADGFVIKIVPTAGSVEALKALEEGKGDVAFIQGGIAAQGDPAKVETLVNVFYEPVWIFYRKALAPDAPIETLPELKGKRIAVGEAGSGTNQLARLMLGDAGVAATNTTFVEGTSKDAVNQLKQGTVDAAFMVAAPSSTTVQGALEDTSLELLSLRRADAFARRHRFLNVLTFPEGTLDLVNNVPRNDVKLVSPVANLMMRKDLHPDLVRLLTIAAVQTHQGGGLFEKRFEFPNVDWADIAPDKEDMAYLERIKGGNSIFDRYLPFQFAALVDRYLLFILPFVLIALPLLSRTPLVYGWYMNSKVNRWYKTVHGIELRSGTMQLPEIDVAITQLEAMDEKLSHELTVSTSYMPNVYTLRGHVDYVITQLRKRRERLTGDTELSTPSTRLESPTGVGTRPQENAGEVFSAPVSGNVEPAI